MVVPVDERSISTTRDCFVSLLSIFTLPVDAVFAFDGVGLAMTFAAAALEARFFAGFDIGILHSGYGDLATPPPKPHLGDQADGAGSWSVSNARSRDSTALIA